MDGDECPAVDFLLNGEAETESNRQGLVEMIDFVAENGLDAAPVKWIHEADKQKKIYEFIKGSLRLFFFRGKNGQIAVCTTGIRKSGQKADKSSVNKAAEYRNSYLSAYEGNTLRVIDYGA